MENLKLPSDLKKDGKGLYYFDKKLTYDNLIIFDHYFDNVDNYKPLFYHASGTNDYIIKHDINLSNGKDYINMLKQFNLLREKISNVDLPIGYYKDRFKVKGTIVRYYENSKSLKNIMSHYGLNEINNFYEHDEDNLHNLFLMLENILSLLEEMYQNGMYYYDTNDGNFVIYKNAVKIIDFEPCRVSFTYDNNSFSLIIANYLKLVRKVLERYHLPIYNLSLLPNDDTYKYKAKEYEIMKKEYLSKLNDFLNLIGNNFDSAKVYIKKIENNVRKDI